MFLFVGFPGTGIDPAAHPPKCLPDETALDVGPRTLLQVLPDYLHGAHLKATQGHCRWGDGFTFSPPRGDGHKAAGQALRTTIGT